MSKDAEYTLSRSLAYPKGTELYIVPVLNSWRDLRSPILGSPNIQGTNAPGFTLIFDDYEAFKAEYPDVEPIRVTVLEEHWGKAS